jgi:hypothetical protein
MSRIFDHEKLELYRAALDVLVAKKRCGQEEVAAGKDRLWRIVAMLVGLIRSNSNYRLHEGEGTLE